MKKLFISACILSSSFASAADSRIAETSYSDYLSKTNFGIGTAVNTTGDFSYLLVHYHINNIFLNTMVNYSRINNSSKPFMYVLELGMSQQLSGTTSFDYGVFWNKQTGGGSLNPDYRVVGPFVGLTYAAPGGFNVSAKVLPYVDTDNNGSGYFTFGTIELYKTF